MSGALGINILKNYKLTKVQNATAAGAADIECDSVDMAGFETAFFFTTPGTITAGAATDIHVETSSDDSTFNDLLGTAITIADSDDNQVFGVEVAKPLERYLRPVISRATQNAVVGEVYCLQGGTSKAPVSNNVTDTITTELHVSPAEGTK